MHENAKGKKMKGAQLEMLRFLALLFILPGLGGLVVSAMVSTHYMDTLPKWPVLEEGRTVPRGIHGTVVYQTPEEDRRLTIMECGSVGCFIVGLGLGLVYLEKWGSAQARNAEEESELAENHT